MTIKEREIIHPDYITTTHSDIITSAHAKHLELYTVDINLEEYTLEVWTEDNRISELDFDEGEKVEKMIIDYYLN